MPGAQRGRDGLAKIAISSHLACDHCMVCQCKHANKWHYHAEHSSKIYCGQTEVQDQIPFGSIILPHLRHLLGSLVNQTSKGEHESMQQSPWVENDCVGTGCAKLTQCHQFILHQISWDDAREYLMVCTGRYPPAVVQGGLVDRPHTTCSVHIARWGISRASCRGEAKAGLASQTTCYTMANTHDMANYILRT